MQIYFGLNLLQINYCLDLLQIYNTLDLLLIYYWIFVTVTGGVNQSTLYQLQYQAMELWKCTSTRLPYQTTHFSTRITSFKHTTWNLLQKKLESRQLSLFWPVWGLAQSICAILVAIILLLFHRWILKKNNRYFHKVVLKMVYTMQFFSFLYHKMFPRKFFSFITFDLEIFWFTKWKSRITPEMFWNLKLAIHFPDFLFWIISFPKQKCLPRKMETLTTNTVRKTNIIKNAVILDTILINHV